MGGEGDKFPKLKTQPLHRRGRGDDHTLALEEGLKQTTQPFHSKLKAEDVCGGGGRGGGRLGHINTSLLSLLSLLLLHFITVFMCSLVCHF